MLELIAVTPDEARIAEAAGAGRIELVSALAEGGLTPGYGLVKQTVAAVRIPVNVMIRPHSRGFHYSRSDLEVMKEELLAARTAGAHGAVLGVLDEDGAVHRAHLEALLECAEGLAVTFHRAIDAARDPLEAVQVLAGYPAIRTILTAGGRGRIEDHAEALKKMQAAAGHIHIMAGGGLTMENTARIVRTTALQDFHYGTAVRRGSSVNGELDPERVVKLIGILAAGGVRAAGLAPLSRLCCGLVPDQGP